MNGHASITQGACLIVLRVAVVGCGEDGPSATVRFESPADGARVAGGLEVAVVADGVDIEPAGEVRAGAGHFHVIADDGCTGVGEGIAKNSDHVHFGAAQTTGLVYLSPGEHRLCLQVGDGAHAATDITYEVTVDDQAEWCQVLVEVDQLFNSVDINTPEDFPISQAIHSNIVRLLEQPAEGVDVIEPTAIDEVRATVGVAATFATAMVGVGDLAAVEDAFRLVDVDDMGPGADWILSACGIDIDGSG